MTPTMLRRFVILMAILTFLGFTAAMFYLYLNPPAGDFEVRRGDIHLGNKEWEEALDDFNRALEKQPDHRGALMGRAIVYLQTGRDAEAEAELTYLIDFLRNNLEEDDATGRGTLAAAYGNLGILYDRQAEYQKALDAYVQAIRIDRDVVEGPGLIDKILYDANPSSIVKRARYLHEQLQLPEDERVLSIPELDEEQRMHKP